MTGTMRTIQPTLLTHADGRVQMLAHGRNGKIVESWSSDGGLIYDCVVSTACCRTTIPGSTPWP